MRAVLLSVAATMLALHGQSEAVRIGTEAIAANSSAGPVFEIDFSNPEAIPAHWTLTMDADGRGHFHSERGAARGDGSLVTETANIDRDVRLSAAFVERVFQTARHQKLFSGGCESHLKVAFQGVKKLTYTGPEGQGSCAYNYSKDKEVQALGDSLIAVAGTIVEGARLEMLLQHDRLGLDREMEYLAEAAGERHAQQIGAIREILERIADDPAVMDRVRKRAKLLLASADE